MKILFISDFNIHQMNGGAQVSNELIIEKGRELGHEIIEHNYDSSPINLIYNYDLVISSNLNIFSRRNPTILNFIVNHKNHIRLEHDSCHYLNNNDRKLLFESSKINFFLSNFHLEFFVEKYGNYFKNIEIVYDPINTNIFYKSNSEIKYDIVYCGFLHEQKGYKNLLNFAIKNPDRNIHIFGWQEEQKVIEDLKNQKNIFLNEKVSHEETAEIFQQSKFVYHSPILNEPFCRMVGEALLCGCEFIGDESKIGSLKEFKKVGYESFKNQCNNAANIFWEKINNEKSF
jgi:glycosyltransferase involved in cell wall biosynthesis